jgi:hypothetical protein
VRRLAVEDGVVSSVADAGSSAVGDVGPAGGGEVSGYGIRRGGEAYHRIMLGLAKQESSQNCKDR